MIELPNVESIKIPLNPEREWIWMRILISIDFYELKNPTTLQWALIKILLNLDKIKQEELTTSMVAEKLGAEKTIIEEGLINLIEKNLVTLQPRKKADILQNYQVPEFVAKTFQKNELIPNSKENQKILLFYDYKDERIYSYQMVEKQDDQNEEEINFKVYENILLALIENIWLDLEVNPHKLVSEVNYSSLIEHKFIKDQNYILVDQIMVNFL
jgi:hypothetical protein